MKLRPGIVAALRRLGVCLGVCAIAGCHRGARLADRLASPVAHRPPTPVSVVAARHARVASVLELAGTIMARSQVNILPKTSGRILELRVDEGYRVSRGQLLARLDTPELGWQLQQQKSLVVTAQANLDQARDNLARMRELSAQGVVSDQQLLGAQTQVRVAEGQLRQAKAALSLMETNVSNSVVTSPIDGVVVAKGQDVGAMAGPATSIVTIAESGSLQAKLTFAERDLAAVREGSRIKLVAAALPGQAFTGRIREIAELVDPQTRLLSCKVDLDRNGRLKIGMNVTGLIEAQPHQGLVVPTAAILNDGAETVVYVANQGKAHRRPVKIGVRNDEQSEISQGLAPGDAVIVRGNVFVREGDPVVVGG